MIISQFRYGLTGTLVKSNCTIHHY